MRLLQIVVPVLVGGGFLRDRFDFRLDLFDRRIDDYVSLARFVSLDFFRIGRLDLAALTGRPVPRCRRCFFCLLKMMCMLLYFRPVAAGDFLLKKMCV